MPKKSFIMQVPEGNYNCHQGANQISSNIQNKGETDIGLLVACKVQLSSEVIRWKTESLRLQKECNISQQKNKDFDLTVSKLLKKNKDLETQLSLAKEENKQLKLKNAWVDDTKMSTIQRLSKNLNKYNSFPTSSNGASPSLSKLLEHSISKQGDFVQEDWREVSQKMLQQMKEEMKELQEMNSCFLSKQNESECSNDNDQIECEEEIEECVSSLVSEANLIKQHLLEQQKKLNLLVRNIGEASGQEEYVSSIKSHQYSQLSNKLNDPNTKDHTLLHRVANVNLIQPLVDISDLNVIRPSNAWNFEEDLTIHPTSENPSEIASLTEEQTNTLVVPERVCPMCQQQFDPHVSQSEFETHVFDHLDGDSETFLDQFVVI